MGFRQRFRSTRIDVTAGVRRARFDAQTRRDGAAPSTPLRAQTGRRSVPVRSPRGLNGAAERRTLATVYRRSLRRKAVARDSREGVVLWRCALSLFV